MGSSHGEHPTSSLKRMMKWNETMRSRKLQNVRGSSRVSTRYKWIHNLLDVNHVSFSEMFLSLYIQVRTPKLEYFIEASSMFFHHVIFVCYDMSNTWTMMRNRLFSFDLYYACGLDNRITAPRTCEVNLKLPTSLLVLNVVAYNWHELLGTRCILFSTVEAPSSAPTSRCHLSSSSFLFFTWVIHHVPTVGSVTPPLARNDPSFTLKL